jgi:hypothetical protein
MSEHSVRYSGPLVRTRYVEARNDRGRARETGAPGEYVARW